MRASQSEARAWNFTMTEDGWQLSVAYRSFTRTILPRRLGPPYAGSSSIAIGRQPGVTGSSACATQARVISVGHEGVVVGRMACVVYDGHDVSASQGRSGAGQRAVKLRGRAHRGCPVYPIIATSADRWSASASTACSTPRGQSHPAHPRHPARPHPQADETRGARRGRMHRPQSLCRIRAPRAHGADGTTAHYRGAPFVPPAARRGWKQPAVQVATRPVHRPQGSPCTPYPRNW